MEKCPLCGERLVKNFCENCGFAVPDETEISSLYNLDPSDDEPEPIREITPEHITEEIYPNRPEPIEFKVREEEKPAPFVNPYANQNNGAAGQRQAGQPYNNMPASPPQQQNPYADNGSFKPYSTSGNSDKLKEDLHSFWWILLISFLFPIIGIAIMVFVKNKFDNRFKTYILIAAVLGFILPP